MFDLTSLRSTYAQALAGIESDFRAESAAVPTRYAEALAALVAQKRKAGDLEGVLAATHESDRLVREKTLPLRPDPGNGDLAAVQRRFIGAEAASTREKSTRVLDLIALDVAGWLVYSQCL